VVTFPVESVVVVVVVHVHFHVTVNTVFPVTVAVKGIACPARTVAAPGETVTMVWLGLELLHAANQMAAPATTAIADCLYLRNFITDFSSMWMQRTFPGHPLA